MSYYLNVHFQGQMVKEFPAFYETRRFITVSIIGRELSLSRAKLINSTPYQQEQPESRHVLKHGVRQSIFKFIYVAKSMKIQSSF